MNTTHGSTPRAEPGASDPDSPRTGAAFATTRWTVVLGAARGTDAARAEVALEQLCRTYWRPIYTYVRRQGHASHDAQDLTQEFFGRLLAGPGLSGVDPARGRFRSFLLASLKHFLANEWDKVRALKRGGGVRIVPLDAAATGGDTEASPSLTSAAPDRSPEAAYDRQWALAVLDRVLSRLEAEHRSAGKGEFFAALRPTLTADRTALPYAVLGRQLGLTEGAVKVAVHRLRQRYRVLLREEIADTVERPDQVDQELRDLFAALGG